MTRRRRAWKVCSTHGCPELVQSGRCNTCSDRADRARGTAHERGYDARWRATREAFLREHPFCGDPSGCLRLAEHVDHLDGLGPLAPRGHDWSNLRGLCRPHHTAKTNREDRGGFGHERPAQRRPT